jgi:hypothetical protein
VKPQRFNESAFLLAVIAARACLADIASKPIVDVRIDGPYQQIASSMGDEWAPTWGRDDVLYTGNDDGSSFGGIPSNTIAFGRLEGSDPNHLEGRTVNGLLEFKEVNYGPEAAGWNTLDSYSIRGTSYQFSRCANEAHATCLLMSSDGNKWSESGPVIKESRLNDPHFIVLSKEYEDDPAFNPKEYVYVASYVGLIDGEDRYLIARVPSKNLSGLKPADWSFLQKDYSWSGVEGASPIPKASEVGPDGANWKTMNTYSIDGVLYMFITRCIYPSHSIDPKRRHTWSNSSIIKSTDGGKTWSRPPQENYDKPMFPGRRFGAPYFVWYGKDGAATVDNANKYVYAISNDGFFENGDDYVIGRVARSKLANLSGAEWAFYVGGDGMSDGAWSTHLGQAHPVLKNAGKSSMTGMTYIESLHRYVLVSWHYNQDNFEAGIKAQDLSTVLEFFEAPEPWGPWSRVKRLDTGKLGWYTPIIGQRFQKVTADGTVRAFLYATGFFTKPAGGLDMSLYKLNYLPITLSTRPLSHEDRAFVGGR